MSRIGRNYLEVGFYTEVLFREKGVRFKAISNGDPKQYIKKMRDRDKELEAKWGTICTPLQILAPDGKIRKTQAANTEEFLESFRQFLLQKLSHLKHG